MLTFIYLLLTLLVCAIFALAYFMDQQAKLKAHVALLESSCGAKESTRIRELMDAAGFSHWSLIDD